MWPIARRRRQVAEEFKIQAVRLAERGKPRRTVAQESGISANMLRRWPRNLLTMLRRRVG
ncbi:MAG: transposase [Gemmatimonadaceae bacterium]